MNYLFNSQEDVINHVFHNIIIDLIILLLCDMGAHQTLLSICVKTHVNNVAFAYWAIVCHIVVIVETLCVQETIYINTLSHKQWSTFLNISIQYGGCLQNIFAKWN